MVELAGQKCALCGEHKSTLSETDLDIPHFGKVFVLTIECAACGYKKSDIELAEKKEPCKYTFEVATEEDLNVRIVKSSEATVKIPQIITIEPGPAADGYVTNVEGLLQNVKTVIESNMDSEEDEDVKNKARNMIKKLGKVLVGREPLKIIIEDPMGFSAIISDKAVRSKL